MSKKRIDTCLLLVITVFFLSIPAFLCAATSVSLTEGESKLVAQGEIVVREVAASGRSGRTFEAIGMINASRDDILQILTTYEQYPEFMPNVSRIDVVERRGDETVLNYTLSLPLGKIKKYRLKLLVEDRHGSPSVVRWRLQDWPGLKSAETIKDTTGFWRIEEKSNGTSLVLYHVYTDPGPVPFGLGWIVDVLSKNSVPEALLQTRARAEAARR